MPNATTLDSCPAEFILSAAAPESPGKDARLLEQLKHQNRRALERVMRRYTAYVGTILRNITRGQASSEDIEELTADVFLALWHHAPEMRTERLTGYLASIARSKGCNWLRKRQLDTQPIDDVVVAADTDVSAPGRTGGTGGDRPGSHGTAPGTGSGDSDALLFLPSDCLGNRRGTAYERIHRQNQNVPEQKKTAPAVYRKGIWL